MRRPSISCDEHGATASIRSCRTQTPDAGAHASLKHELGGLRTGRASASLLEPVHVEAYGQRMPLTQVASISVPEPRALGVRMGQGMVQAVDKAIRTPTLVSSPTVEGSVFAHPHSRTE